MAMLRLAALGALGFVAYRYFGQQQQHKNAAFADDQAGGENFSQVRDAGPAAMADPPGPEWNKTDEEGDESFPASDPPANY